MLHGCRQLVPRGVGLSPATSATLILCCPRGISEETASDKLEEGGDDVKSSWPLCPGLHTCYNGYYRGQRDREVEPIPKSSLSWDRSLQLGSVNVESLVIADQLCRGEYVPGPCTHRPSHHESLLYPKLVS